MSEEHHLSRKQLREQGKLAVRDAAAPSLTTTAELRLRRPSRRELREAERANKQAEEKIRQSAANTQKGGLAPERISLYDRSEQKNKSDINDGGFLANFSPQTDSASRAADSSSEAERDDSDAFDEIIAEKSTAGTHSTHEDTGSSFNDFFAEIERADGEEETADSPGDVDEEPEYSSPEKLNRTSLFDRFTDDKGEEQSVQAHNEHSLPAEDSSAHLDSSVCEAEQRGNCEYAEKSNLADSAAMWKPDSIEEQHETNVNPEGDEADVAVDAHAPAADLEKFADTAQSADEDLPAVEAADEENPEDNAAEQTVTQSISAQSDTALHTASVSEEHATEKAAENEKAAEKRSSVEEVVPVDVKTGNSAFGWLVLLILIIIGALIGYLLGTWITVTFLSAPEAGFDQLASTVLTL